MGAMLSGRLVPRWEAQVARAGEILHVGQARQGCRSYLCIQGGLAVPLVLGSASTHLQSQVGGFEGRALRKGDRLKTQVVPSDPARPVAVAGIESEIFRKTFSVTCSIHSDLFEKNDWYSFLEQEYTVSEQSNRLGLRLEGAPLASERIPEVVTAGVSLGTIQISSDGKPTLLFVEQQLTGGYPQIACVCSRDLAAIGQLKPRDRIRFVEVTP
jgi:antagonist of KipI